MVGSFEMHLYQLRTPVTLDNVDLPLIPKLMNLYEVFIP